MFLFEFLKVTSGSCPVIKMFLVADTAVKSMLSRIAQNLLYMTVAVLAPHEDLTSYIISSEKFWMFYILAKLGHPTVNFAYCS